MLLDVNSRYIHSVTRWRKVAHRRRSVLPGGLGAAWVRKGQE